MKIKKLLSRTALVLITILISETVGFGFAQAEEISSQQSSFAENQGIQNNQSANLTDANNIDEQNVATNVDDKNQEQAEEPSIKRESDFTNIVKQTTDYTCGPAALATLINQMGGNVNEMQMATLSGTTMENGTTMRGLKDAAKKIGYEVSLKNSTFKNLSKYTLPILFYEKNDDGSNHYAVIKEVKNETVSVADPSAGNIEYANDDFIKIFSGKILMLTLPKEVKNGQSADVALQILEEKGAVLTDTKGNVLDIDDLKDELSDSDAQNVNGKFAQVLVIPIAEVGSVLIIGGVVIGITWYFSNIEKILNGSLKALDTHVNKFQDPCNSYTSAIKKTIKNVIEVIDKKLPKASNSFRKSFEKKYNPLREKALKMINKDRC